MCVTNFPSIRQYKIKESLGKGQFGDVYKVLNTNDKKIYCMKSILMKKEITFDNEESTEKINKIKEATIKISEAADQIKKEAEILKKLDHENIIKYYESFEEKGYFFIIMEYCETDLKQFIQNYKSEKNYISEFLILDFVLDICCGLKEIHSHNIIHRDLKPENLFVSNQLKIKIGDFGISKQLESPLKHTQTKNIGTFLYMAPEMILENEYNYKVDIWALGCIVYELCTLNNYSREDTSLIHTINGIKSDGNINLKIYDIKVQNLINMLLEDNYKNRPNLDAIIDYCLALKRRNSKRQFINMLDCYYIISNSDNKNENQLNSNNSLLEDEEIKEYNNEEIKDDFQDEKRETTGLIFCILFYSKKIPEIENMLFSLNNKIYKSNSLKLIICICDETEEEYDEALSKIKRISCSIINYDIKNRDLFIKKYNITSLPTMIILDKYGKVIDSLNKERIMNFKECDIIKWREKFDIPNELDNKKHELWKRAKINKHEHELIYGNNFMKPGYSKCIGFFCDTCLKPFDDDINFFCPLCEYDVCDECFEKYKC